MANHQIRQAAKKLDVKFWELGDALGVSEATVTRMLRRELDAEKQTSLLKIIETVAQQKSNAAVTEDSCDPEGG